MEVITYVVFIILMPCLLAYIGRRVLKNIFWIIVIEAIMILILTFIGIIENNPMGNTQRQLASYFSQFNNDFYIKYLPFVTLTIIFMRLFKGRQRP